MEVLFGCFNCTKIDIDQGGQSKSIGFTNLSVYDQHQNQDQSTTSEATTIKKFKWEELERMTSNFTEVIGVGGFSTVYLARFSDSGFGAVKVYNFSERLRQVFKEELEITSKLNHQNIVSILGFCDERDVGALVFEHIPHGNLQEMLHTNTTRQVLPWKARTSIAFQLSQALDHLHEQRSPHIVHGDIKSSNILLTISPNSPQDLIVSCKLCDFGSAKPDSSSSVNSPSSTSSRVAMMGSPGYMDPHYLMTGITSKKNDIYSFGVLLLELITGLEAFCPKKERLLASYVRTENEEFDIEKVVAMVDPKLGEGFDVKEVKAMACMAAMCLHHLPSLRPCATQICKAMKENLSF